MINSRELSTLLIDGPISIYIYQATNSEILEAFERLQPLVRTAALETHRKLDATVPDTWLLKCNGF